MSQVTVGVDPGCAGAVVALSDRGLLICAHPLPVVGPAKARRLDSLAFDRLLATLDDGKESGECSAAIEELVSFPGRGAIGAQTSGILFGAMMAVLELRNWPIRTVSGKTWQKAVGGLPARPPSKCPRKIPAGTSKGERKRIEAERRRESAAHRKNLKAAIVQKAWLACPELARSTDGLAGKADGFCDAYWVAQWGRAISAHGAAVSDRIAVRFGRGATREATPAEVEAMRAESAS